MLDTMETIFNGFNHVFFSQCYTTFIISDFRYEPILLIINVKFHTTITNHRLI